MYTKRNISTSGKGVSSLAVVWLLACCSAAAWLLLGSTSHPHPTNVSQAIPVRATPAAWNSATGEPARCAYQRIESIHVGQRVVTPGTDLSQPLPTAVDSATWKRVELRMVNRWADGTLDNVEVDALEPPEWMDSHRVTVGAKVPLPVDVADLAEPGGLAEVLSIEPCPAIQPGPGRVVMTTINHLNNFVFDLTIRDAEGHQSSVGVTGWHKLFSESRGWVSTATLTAGEVLRGREGPLTVASLARRHETDRVYNMTVEGNTSITCRHSTYSVTMYWIAVIWALTHPAMFRTTIMWSREESTLLRRLLILVPRALRLMRPVQGFPTVKYSLQPQERFAQVAGLLRSRRSQARMGRLTTST